jgi:ATP-dependent Clp protease ATP-binding subunit ClpA
LLTIDAAELRDEELPVGSCLFLGPSGVGKTYLAKLVSETYFNNPKACIVINMAEHNTESDTVRLIGQVEGWRGSEGGGQLTNFLAKYPSSVVVLDEFEKAHPNVQKLFLAAFDQGFVYNGYKHKVDCSQALFVATSNRESKKILELRQSGYSDDDILDQIESELTRHFSPELYGRFTKSIFSPLTLDDLNHVCGLELIKVADRLFTKRSLTINFDASVQKHLMSYQLNPVLGARPLIQLINRQIVKNLAKQLIKLKPAKGTQLVLSFKENQYQLELL